MSHELILDLILDAPKETLYRCWTTPELVVRWFAPAPWSIARAELDVRPGGACNIVMKSPEGEEMPNEGVFLEVVTNQKLVTTDAFTAGWKPKEGTPFMTAEVTFEDAPGGKTRYRAVARHWNAEAKAQHEQMGFHTGWTQCAKQLEELARSL